MATAASHSSETSTPSRAKAPSRLARAVLKSNAIQHELERTLALMMAELKGNMFDPNAYRFGPPVVAGLDEGETWCDAGCYCVVNNAVPGQPLCLSLLARFQFDEQALQSLEVELAASLTNAPQTQGTHGRVRISMPVTGGRVAEILASGQAAAVHPMTLFGIRSKGARYQEGDLKEWLTVQIAEKRLLPHYLAK